MMTETGRAAERFVPIWGAHQTDEAAHLTTCVCMACEAGREFRDDLEAGATTGTTTTTTAAGSLATLGQMADYLTDGFWGNGTGLRHNLGSSGSDPNNGVLHYNLSGFGNLPNGGVGDFNGITAARRELVRDAFDLYSAALGIEFVETTSTNANLVDFFFSDNQSGAFAGSVRYGDGTILYSYVNVASNWSGGTSTYDDYTFQTILHEIGHALGLGHQGNYNGGADYGSDALYRLDSWQATMMSYFSQTENTAIQASYEFLQTPMAVDWLALDRIYGQFGYGTDNAFTGNTVYGFNTNITASQSKVWNKYADYAGRTASTIVDGGGTDTLDVSGFAEDQLIDLTVQTAGQKYQNASNIGGSVGNLTLAVGTVIENAKGGSGDDRFIGNAAANTFRGGAGNDSFFGAGGNDYFDGQGGFDVVEFSFDLASYTVSVVGDALRVVGEGIDTVKNTVESLLFGSTAYSYADLAGASVNAAPVARSESFRISEGGVRNLDVRANDSDADGDALAVTRIDGQAIATGQTVTLDSGATVKLRWNGSIDYATGTAFDGLVAGQTASDDFVYTVSDGSGGTGTATVRVTVDGVGEPAPFVVTGPIGQAGTVTTSQPNRDTWTKVNFDAPIADAVVVMGPVTFNGGQASTTRVRNVTDTGFEFQIDEWDYLGGGHMTESIGWLALSEGSHTLSTGQTIVAGTQSVGTGYETVGFGTSLSNAVVLTEVTTVNEASAVAVQARDVTSTGFSARLREEEAGGAHPDETVSWIAVEAGRGTGIEATVTPRQLDERVDAFQFRTAFDVAPVLLADMQTTYGADTSSLRMKTLDRNGLSIFVQEEQSRDLETGHVDEVLGFLAIQDGLIYA